MSGIFDQIINYSPPLIVSGTVNYKGTWNASTNNPTLNNPPAASTKGDYYVVSTAGTQFSITFAVGDWIISNGTAWEKVDLTDAVSSVFGRTGAVVGVSTDYSAVGITNTAIGASSPSTGAFTTVSASTPIAVASGGTGVTTSTGTTNVVLSNSPTLVTPILGTPQSGTLTSCTGLPISTGVSGLGTGIATALAVNTGSAGAPVLFNGALGTPTSGTVTNLTGTASININGTVGATTPAAGAFTTITGTGLLDVSTASSSGSNVNLATLRQNYAGTAGHEGFLNFTNISGTSIGKIGTRAVDGNNTSFVIRNFVSGSLADAAVFTSTGLNSTAIGATTPSTGAFTTLGATGDIISSSTGIIYANSTNNIPLRLESQTTGYSTLRITNTGGASFFGAEGSAGGTLVVGSTAYDTFIRAPSGIAFSANAGSAMQMRLSSTGLAVTGALSATGAVSIDGGAVNNLFTFNSLNTTSGFGSVRFRNGATKYAWQISAQNNVDNVFEITPSTAVGGTTFTTPVLQVGTTGVAVTGALSSTGALAIGNTVNTVSPTSPNRTVTIVIGGTTYYLAAKTTND